MPGSTLFKAGAAKIDITPPVGVWLDGIPRAQPSDAVRDPLHARALVVSGRGQSGAPETACLVTCDLIGLGAGYARQVREAIGKALDVEVSRILIACSHDHSGPATIGYFSQPEKEYLLVLADKLVQVCRQAAAGMQPALLGTGQGQETSISHYRRLWHRNGGIVMNWEEYPPEEILGPAEEGDPEVGVVRINALDGQTIAVVFNFACHPNSLTGDNFTITADFPGFAAGLVEAELGGVALFTNGAQGSVDVEGFVDRDFYGIERRGRALGREVLRVCAGIAPQPGPVVGASTVSFLLPYRRVRAQNLRWAEAVATTARAQLVTLRDGISDEIMARMILEAADKPESGIDFELLGIRLGDALLVGIPGELFTEIGRRVKALSSTLRIFPVSLGNGSHGYLPTQKAIGEGGYGTQVASGAPFTENADDVICFGVERILHGN